MFSKPKYKALLLIIFSAILYFYCAYFLERTAFYQLFSLWILLFGCFYLLIKKSDLSFSNLVGISILFRLIFLFATPNLSQDFYRFIWDGRLILEGLNPYLSLPENFIEQGILPVSDAKELYAGMGELNGSHYTNYPPLNQLSFLLAALFANKSIFASIVILRLQIILADIGILYFGQKLLKHLNLSKYAIFWYGLNPFVIVEMTGNLHFEPVMLFFFIWAIYLLFQKKWFCAAVILGCSISVKLIPFLFLPLFLRWFINPFQSQKTDKMIWQGFKLKPKKIFKTIGFYSTVLLTVLLLFLPFYSSEFVANYSNSIGLWFKKFEFNASFYYLFREIGYWFRGYNEIAIIGKILPIITLVFVLFFSFFKDNSKPKKLLLSCLFTICIYYLLSTTVHPWYLATPLLLSVFTKFRFTVVWTFLIILSYQTYSNETFQENLALVALQYLVVFAFFIYEKNQKQKIII